MILQNGSEFVLSNNALGAGGGAVLFADTPFSLQGPNVRDFVPVNTVGGTVVVTLPAIGSDAAPLGKIISIVKLTVDTNAVTITAGNATDCIDFTGAANTPNSTLLSTAAAIMRVQLQACSIAGVNRWMPITHSLVA